jgi:hypothetical protein
MKLPADNLAYEGCLSALRTRLKLTELVLGLSLLGVVAGELAHVTCLWVSRALTVLSALADKRYMSVFGLHSNARQPVVSGFVSNCQSMRIVASAFTECTISS